MPLFIWLMGERSHLEAVSCSDESSSWGFFLTRVLFSR
ncbi:hypothetical protein COLO4_37621 [Corchorus olitorius]|uniref:Uncharacterized protein n=1 Tax=Corchorus olitorius TaxID=93759 RepID=A0A1R3G0D1_9ROSI|nr:hypothetical protein COLO4_37621 [Corchorus olitorius]